MTFSPRLSIYEINDLFFLQCSQYPQGGVQLQSVCLCEKSYSCGSVCYFEGHQSAIIKDCFNMHPVYATGDHIFGIWCTFLTVTHLTTTYTLTIYALLHYSYKAWATSLLDLRNVT